MNKPEGSNMPVKNSRFSFYSLILLFVIVGMIPLLPACEVSNNSDKVPEIIGVRHINPDSAAAMQLEKVGPGETFVIEGRNLTSTKRAFFNGIQASFNPAMVTGRHMVISIPGDMPFGILDPDSDEMNTIKLVSDAGETVFQFPILPPEPVIEYVNKEFAQAGETVRLTGRFLYLVNEVTFPGGVTANQFSAAEDGSWLDVVVPEGIVEAGFINVTTTSGTTEESYRNMFNNRMGIFIDFDEKNSFDPWGPTPVVAQDIPGINPLDGNYLHWHYTNIEAGQWWTQELATPFADWAGLEWPDYPAGTDLRDMVFRMEINVPVDTFISGRIEIDFGWVYNYQWNPFIVDDERQALTTDGWETVTIPLERVYELGANTYGDIQLAEFLLRYINPDTDVPFDELSIAYDNIRIVPRF